ncbi:MAG: cation:proton antiporter, partial [Asgard group archaeon]|nr:cation:proton antiporter [Asgard group archaeon]
ILKQINIPEALGFILMGIVIGPSVLGIIDSEMIMGESKIIFQTITGVTLGFIGFHIGNEIKISKLKNEFKSYASILFGQAIITLLLLIAGISGFVLGFYNSNGFYLVFLIAAIALPTAPAITASCIKEYEACGPTTSTLLFVIGLDDVFGIIAAEFALSIATLHYFPASGTNAVAEAIISPFITILGSVFIGLILGFIFAFVLNKVNKTTLTIEFLVGTILAIVGICEVLHFSELLACMTFGFILGNMDTDRNERAIKYGEQIFSPVILLFFVLAGASMNLKSMFSNWLVIVIAIVAIIMRALGKWLGTFLGGLIANAPPAVRKFLGFGLFSQGEMTIGLSMLIYNQFINYTQSAEPGSPAAMAASDGSLLLNVLGLSILVFQIIGPFATKWGLKKADEIPVVEEKVKFTERIKNSVYHFLNRIGIQTEELPLLPIQTLKGERLADVSVSTVGDVAADVATGSVVKIATPAAIEAAIPAASNAAAEAALKAVIKAVSEKSIENPLEAPLEEISEAVKLEVSKTVGAAVGDAVLSAITSENVQKEVEQAVEGAVSDTLESYEDIDNLDVQELMESEDFPEPGELSEISKEILKTKNSTKKEVDVKD